ncbi:purine/pyrimidine permease [Paenibacillus sp. J2TS4]|uniref:purine/pyrimidine permease n=1 Tax=Paenibacillus sp. J2TS4 TaxID=2807194 RepID=UPI001B0D45BF|nr:purine/pyrimidine permease [Paenibacillus sp. J2TS4]GIP33154.1 xanthine permease [Paenibacillus sp. J2TS4]
MNNSDSQALLYRLNDRPQGTVLWLSAIQWFIFMLANFVTVPIVLGQTLGLGGEEIALFTSRTLFLCGLIGGLQVLFGHRLPIIEGPAGMWWGVFLVLITMNAQLGGTTETLLAELQMGLIVSSLVFILIALFRLLHRLRALFTPIITGTFLILLAMQVSKSLVEGILGIGYEGSEHVLPKIVLLSLLLISITVGLMMKAKGIIQSMAILIGLGTGWLLFAVLGMVRFPEGQTPWVALPEIFPFGAPQWNTGVVITCVITSLILLSNLIASIQVFAVSAGEKTTDSMLNKGSFITGVGTLLSGLFGTIAAVPLTAAASLVALTRIASGLPFLIASIGFVVLGLLPKVGQWLSSIPQPVGYAILFTVFGQLLGFGLRDLKQLKLDQRDLFVVGFSLLAGIGLLFVPGHAWEGLPSIVGFLLGNGLIVGVTIAVLLEHVIFRVKKEEADPQ